MTLAEINPLGKLKDGSFVALDAHMDMENEARGRPQGAARRPRRRRRGDPPGARGDRVRARRRGGRRRQPPRRRRQRHRVRRRPRPGDRRRRRLADALRRRAQVRRQAGQLLRDRRQPVGREGLRPGQARAQQAGRGQDRGDDVDRLQHAGRHRRPRRHQGLPGARAWTRRRRSRSSASRAPGRRRASRSSSATACATPTAPSPCTRRAKMAVEA